MPQVEVRVPKGTEGFHGPARVTLGQQIRMQSIELACEQLMVQTKRGVEGNALKSALEAYKELKDLIGEETDMLERSQLMLKVVGNNLMADDTVQTSNSS